MQIRWLDAINWDANGLVPVIAQDWHNKNILMQAFVTREALQLAVQEQRAIYWSRSRQKLWRKGEESGHVQILHEVLLDCDGDSLIYVVEQLGGIACHTGRGSCYFNRLGPDMEWQVDGRVLKEPGQIYTAPPKD
jgi:phosphoribosyl-AMP cyclohydrolase